VNSLLQNVSPPTAWMTADTFAIPSHGTNICSQLLLFTTFMRILCKKEQHFLTSRPAFHNLYNATTRYLRQTIGISQMQ
jgi:hypothetical protein